MLSTNDMNAYYISDYTVKHMWGYKTYHLVLFKHVNVIIGPNASGKTTLINILYDTLTANVARLCRTQFSEVHIRLRSFTHGEIETLSVRQTEGELHIVVKEKIFELPLLPFQHFDENRGIDTADFLKRRYRINISELQETLRGLVPAVWLPVSRRLPIAEEEDLARRPLHRKPLESVDECLAGLIEGLQRYRLSLNAELSELRKDFQRHALANILYDKKHDRALRHPSQLTEPSEADKAQLLKAFRDVGFVDRRMEERINEHFAAAKEAIASFKLQPTRIPFERLLIFPLIARTRAIVEFAQELEQKRERLFSSLHEYEAIVNSFLNEKSVSVSDQGELIITPHRPHQGTLEWRHLSSGEKQILILLTQALLSSQSPVVYVADEPELSLHVSWQEKLLGSLTRLAPKCQFIVATHSPDITSGFGDNIIDLARL